MIVGGSCFLNHKINTSLTNDSETTENELENMKVDWKVETLISFGNHKKSFDEWIYFMTYVDQRSFLH